MTEIEKIWASKIRAVCAERGLNQWQIIVGRLGSTADEAACRLIEEFEAFKQEVSDAVENHIKQTDEDCSSLWRVITRENLSRFIIAKPEPDPLESAMRKALPASMPDHHVKAICKNLRRELPGLKIVEVDDD